MWTLWSKFHMEKCEWKVVEPIKKTYNNTKVCVNWKGDEGVDSVTQKVV
jgi:hypothetical protein